MCGLERNSRVGERVFKAERRHINNWFMLDVDNWDKSHFDQAIHRCDAELVKDVSAL